MSMPLEMKTSNGYDAQFGTNVLGHYLFTKLLLPALIHTAQTSKVASKYRSVTYIVNALTALFHADDRVRVVNTASGAHWVAPKGGIDYATVEPNSPAADKARKKMGTDTLYAQSKWVRSSAQLTRS